MLPRKTIIKTIRSWALQFIIALIVAVHTAPIRAQPEVRYIIDTVVVTVRGEANDSSEILGRISSGDRVMRTGATNDRYEEIRLENGTVGWVDKRYLSEQQVAQVRLKAVNDELESLRQVYRQAHEELSESEESLIRLSDDYSRLLEEHEELRRTAGQPNALEGEVAQLKERLALTEAETDQLHRSNKELKESSDTRWFLIGAGVLFAGMVLGLAIPRGRRNRSSWDRF